MDWKWRSSVMISDQQKPKRTMVNSKKILQQLMDRHQNLRAARRMDQNPLPLLTMDRTCLPFRPLDQLFSRASSEESDGLFMSERPR
jgi:hypothetical protein